VLVPGEVRLGVGDRGFVALDRDDLAALPHRVGEEGREEPDAGVEVEGLLALGGLEHVQHGLDEETRRDGCTCQKPSAATR
jgi:hypothetical protein